MAHCGQTFRSVGLFAHPQVEFPTGIEQEDVGLIEFGLFDLGFRSSKADPDLLSLRHLGDVALALSGKTEQRRNELLDRLVLLMIGRTNVRHFTGKRIPKLLGLIFGVVGVLVQHHNIALCAHSFGHGVGTHFLIGIGLLSIPQKDLFFAEKENKAISRIERALFDVDFVQSHGLFGSLDAVQVGLFRFFFNMTESRGHPSCQIQESSIEVFFEHGTFMGLDLTVLNGRITQKVIAFDHLVGGRAVLVLGGILANPNV
mmetsp:Transcript_1898/g.4543  ORF Transcript_1898/g.4543 Transcript_1898/m.4543 type:complete len:258 (+) Transcript_1898:230-1003(+)